MEKKKRSYTAGGNINCSSHCRRAWEFLKELKIELPYDPAFLLLNIYTEKTKILIQKDKSTPMFTAALFTIAKTWKQLKYPSTNK